MGRVPVLQACRVDCLKFVLEMLGRADVVGTSGEGSDDTVFGGGGSAGIVAYVEVGMSRFSVDGCGLVRVNVDVHEGEVAVGRGVFYGVDEVFCQGVEV